MEQSVTIVLCHFQTSARSNDAHKQFHVFSKVTLDAQRETQTNPLGILAMKVSGLSSVFFLSQCSSLNAKE